MGCPAYESSEKPPLYTADEGLPPEAIQAIEDTLKELSPALRQLSLDIWGAYSYTRAVSHLASSISCAEHPEIGFKEK